MGKASRKDHRLTFRQNFLVGGISGVVARTITSPLDVVKILSQVGSSNPDQGIIASLLRLYRQEGVKSFFKGNGIACARMFPYNACQFAFYNKISVFIQKLSQTNKLSPFQALIAGSLAGVGATLITYPLDTLKTKITISLCGSEKHGLVSAARSIYDANGLRGFYRGVNTSIIGVIPYAGGTFMTYEVMQRAWGKDIQLTAAHNFLNGCIAAAVAQTFSFPFDTIRKKMQAGAAGGQAYKSTVDAFRIVAKNEGMSGLWRGSTPNLVKVVPNAGITFAAFELMKKVFLFRNGYTVSPFSVEPRPGIDQNLLPHQARMLR